jgi:hypothetical protein
VGQVEDNNNSAVSYGNLGVIELRHSSLELCNFLTPKEFTSYASYRECVVATRGVIKFVAAMAEIERLSAKDLSHASPIKVGIRNRKLLALHGIVAGMICKPWYSARFKKGPIVLTVPIFHIVALVIDNGFNFHRHGKTWRGCSALEQALYALRSRQKCNVRIYDRGGYRCH